MNNLRILNTLQKVDLVKYIKLNESREIFTIGIAKISNGIEKKIKTVADETKDPKTTEKLSSKASPTPKKILTSSKKLKNIKLLMIDLIILCRVMVYLKIQILEII